MVMRRMMIDDDDDDDDDDDKDDDHDGNGKGLFRNDAVNYHKNHKQLKSYNF